jgi:hypothetical protein
MLLVYPAVIMELMGKVIILILLYNSVWHIRIDHALDKDFKKQFQLLIDVLWD